MIVDFNNKSVTSKISIIFRLIKIEKNIKKAKNDKIIELLYYYYNYYHSNCYDN